MNDITERRDFLTHHIASRTTVSSDITTLIPNLTLFRREAPTSPDVCMVEPSIVLIVQGVKQLFVGGQPYRYDAERFLVTSLGLPATSQVLTASREEPCLGLTLTLDLRMMAELIAQGGLVPPRERTEDRGVAVGAVTLPLLEPLIRLVQLLDDPAAVPILAPLMQREIHYRLLRSDQAARLWQIASAGSQSHQVVRAIDWLKAHYASPLQIEALAEVARMRPSTFHHHFRQLTAMSPLQYQKWLRLSEARRLMMNEDVDAASAGFQVGYESPSHFSREYSRLFGAPPRRDVEQLRHAAG